MATTSEEEKKVEQAPEQAAPPPAAPAAPAEVPAPEQKINEGAGVARREAPKTTAYSTPPAVTDPTKTGAGFEKTPAAMGSGSNYVAPGVKSETFKGERIEAPGMRSDPNEEVYNVSEESVNSDYAPQDGYKQVPRNTTTQSAPAPAPAPEEKKEFAYSDLFEPEEETEEERKKREKLEKNRQLWAMLGDGISALANITGTAYGARSVLDGSEGLSARASALFEKEKEARDKRFAENKARNVALRQKLREEELAKYKAETERQNAETRAKLADSTVAKDESVIEKNNTWIEWTDERKRAQIIKNEALPDMLMAEINHKRALARKAIMYVAKDRSTGKYHITVGNETYTYDNVEAYRVGALQLAKENGVDTKETYISDSGYEKTRNKSTANIVANLESIPASTPASPPAPPKVKVTSVDTLYQALKQKNPGMGMSLDQVRATCKNVQGIDSLLKTAISWGAVPAGTTREGLMKKMGLKLQTKNQAKPKQSAQPNKQQGKSQQGKQQSKGQQQGQPKRNAQGQIDLEIQWQ